MARMTVSITNPPFSIEPSATVTPITDTINSAPLTKNTTSLIRWFSATIGLSILGYLNPLHSPIGHDFLVNVFSFIVMSFGVGVIFFKKDKTTDSAVVFNRYSISVYTWLALSILLCVQPFLSDIKYADALIFPVSCLMMIALLSLVTTTLLQTTVAKRQFLNQLSIWVYITLVLTFIIQIMQALHYEIHLPNGLPFTRLSNFPNRLDGNFGQPNHTAYAFVLGICLTLYQMTLTKHRAFQGLLLVLLAMFSVGIFFTLSRGGVLMVGLASIVYFFSQAKSLKYKLVWCGGIIVIFGISYAVIGHMLSNLIFPTMEGLSAVSRIANEAVDSPRIGLTQKALLIFQDYPIKGIGWRNFSIGAIPHVDDLAYVAFSDNSHMFLTQIASELGILGLLCLLPIVWLLLRVCHMRHSPESAMALAFVIASIAYASLEYPFWYFRFLSVFGVFLAIIEQKNPIAGKVTQQSSQWFGLASLVLAFASTYYCYQFWNHKYLFWYTHPESVSQNGEPANAHKDRNVFGFLNYNDMDVAPSVNITPTLLSQKLALFDRVLVDEGSVYNMVSYGQLLSFDGQYPKALEVFKTACRLTENKENCEAISNTLKEDSEKYPEHFKANYEAYQAWVVTRNLK